MRAVLFWFAIALMLFAFLFPVFWVYLTSLKQPEDIFGAGLIFEPTFYNYRYLVEVRPSLNELLNSMIVSVASTIIVMAVSVPAAYSFARFNTGNGHLLFITISTRMFPGVVAAIPFFIAFRELNLLDTHFGLTMLYVYFNMSFATFLLYGFFREIPTSLENAAMLDGYNRIDVLRKVIFPLIKPGVAITTMFCLIWSWNEFLYAFLFTRRIARTASVGLSTFWGSVEIQWGPMAAFMGIAILPTLVAAWLMQRHIVRGLTFGAVKG
ncbi:MAG: carbohydrate ABC transporter permease [Rhodobacter sp.]|nr:carbohydrate ABC transporter permease [Rhodobacter sp.]MCY4166901.1 carbohydrate ABC transporter permease [Rhodobacter sp.]MCY4241182.1 carbohydrate ABC transporter permease [Rhodobacter sp.]